MKKIVPLSVILVLASCSSGKSVYTLGTNLLFKYKIHRQNEADTGIQMIETEPDILEKHDGKNYKDDERNDFLKHLQLKQAERAAISFKANPVRRHLKHIFKQRKAPTDQNNCENSCFLQPTHFPELQMSIPRQGHENIGNNQKKNGGQSFAHRLKIKKCP